MFAIIYFVQAIETVFDLFRRLSYSVFGWPVIVSKPRSFVPGASFDDEFSKAKGLADTPALVIDKKTDRSAN